MFLFITRFRRANTKRGEWKKQHEHNKGDRQICWPPNTRSVRGDLFPFFVSQNYLNGRFDWSSDSTRIMYKLTRILFKHFRFMLRSTYRYTQTLAANATLSIYFSITHKRNRRKISPRPLLLAFLGLFFFSRDYSIFAVCTLEAKFCVTANRAFDPYARNEKTEITGEQNFLVVEMLGKKTTDMVAVGRRLRRRRRRNRIGTTLTTIFVRCLSRYQRTLWLTLNARFRILFHMMRIQLTQHTHTSLTPHSVPGAFFVVFHSSLTRGQPNFIWNDRPLFPSRSHSRHRNALTSHIHVRAAVMHTRFAAIVDTIAICRYILCADGEPIWSRRACSWYYFSFSFNQILEYKYTLYSHSFVAVMGAAAVAIREKRTAAAHGWRWMAFFQFSVVVVVHVIDKMLVLADTMSVRRCLRRLFLSVYCHMRVLKRWCSSRKRAQALTPTTVAAVQSALACSLSPALECTRIM